MLRTVTKADLEQGLTSLEDARRTLFATLRATSLEEVAVGDALGRVLATSLISSIDVPGTATSAMDGYAIDTSLPERTRHIGLNAARGDAVETMTGWPIPPNANAVVPWEDTSRLDEYSVELSRNVAAGANIRPCGEDLGAGESAITAGTTLTPLHLAIASSVGNTHLVVHRRPRVAIASTGNEVCRPGEPRSHGGMYDANSALLRGCVERAGGVVVESTLLKDDPEVIASWLQDAVGRADLVVTSGGASVGVHDWLPSIIAERGERLVWKIAQKPGKPVCIGRIGGTTVVALPGNPAGVWGAAHTLIAPAVRSLAGGVAQTRTRTLVLDAPVVGSQDRVQLQPVAIEGTRARPLPARSSVALAHLAAADGIAFIPSGGASAGDRVEVEDQW